MRCLTVAQVIQIHEAVILPNELQGVAANKSLDAVLARIDNRIAYGLIEDVFDLAASYATCIAVAHCFNDANKRTAHTAMQVVLRLNAVEIQYAVEEMGDMIIKAATGAIDEGTLAAYLRQCALNPPS